MPALPKKLAILAGGGALPKNVAEACRRESIPALVVNLGGAADEWINEYEPLDIALGQVGRLLETLKAEGCDSITMAGPLTRPQLSKVRFDWQGAKLLPRVTRLFRKGDDALLRGIAEMFEEQGFRVVGPEILLEDILVTPGVMTKTSPTNDAVEDIAIGRKILSALGPHDVGQAVVVVNGVCMAVEAAEGTAQMLQRVSALRMSDGSSGVLVKLPKPNQDHRVDLPTIGPQTVDAASGACLAGIAVEAGNGFIIDREETIRRCDEAGLFLIGLTPPEQ